MKNDPRIQRIIDNPELFSEMNKRVALENIYSDRIIKLVELKDEVTTSDLQGMAMAIVTNLIADIKKIGL